MNIVRFNFNLQGIEPELLMIVGVSLLIICYQVSKVILYFVAKK